MSDGSHESDREELGRATRTVADRVRLRTAKRIVAELPTKYDEFVSLRREFFEKLVVLAGGTVALSMTVLGTFASRKTAPRAVWVIELAWVLLTTSLLFGILRNWLDSEMGVRRHFTSLSEYMDYVSTRMREEVEPGKEMDEQVTALQNELKQVSDLQNRTKQRNRVISALSFISLLSLVTGYVSLVGFAIANINALLP